MQVPKSPRFKPLWCQRSTILSSQMKRQFRSASSWEANLVTVCISSAPTMNKCFSWHLTNRLPNQKSSCSSSRWFLWRDTRHKSTSSRHFSWQRRRVAVFTCWLAAWSSAKLIGSNSTTFGRRAIYPYQLNLLVNRSSLTLWSSNGQRLKSS
jgi:hypothetical protein